MVACSTWARFPKCYPGLKLGYLVVPKSLASAFKRAHYDLNRPGQMPVQAALAWGSSRFTRTVAMINPENTPSEAVAQRCGFVQFGTSRYKNAPTGLWEFRW